MDIFDGIKDIEMSIDGDFVVYNNDLKINTGITWFIQEVNKIVKSNAADWFFAPNAGADIMQYYGQINSRELGQKIQQDIKYKIEKQNINYPAELSVKVVPLSHTEIKCYITLNTGDRIIDVSRVIFNLNKGIQIDTEVIEKQENITIPNKHPYAEGLFK